MAVPLPRVHGAQTQAQEAQEDVFFNGVLGRKPPNELTLSRCNSSPASISPAGGSVSSKSGSHLLGRSSRSKHANPWHIGNVKKSDSMRLAQIHGLPRSGPEGTDNTKRLGKLFPFRGFIEGAENRGITIDQLSQVHQFAETYCGDWHLGMDAVTVYNLMMWVIRPATKAKSSSMVEHLAEKEQPPQWFVSHWWGEPVVLFMKCIRAHASLRGVDMTTCPLWICAYAARQQLEQDAVVPHDETKKAMKVARFRMLVILDGEVPDRGPATPFKRVWCIFETAMCLDQGSGTFDIACCQGDEVELLTDGLIASEKSRETYHPGKGIEAKTQREAAFPHSILEASLSLDVKRAAATVAEQRTLVLEKMIAAGLEVDPDEEEDELDAMSQRVRGLFANFFFRQVLLSERPKQGDAQKRFIELQNAISKSVRKDVWRKSLKLFLVGCDLSVAESMDLVRDSIPPKVSTLALDLTRTGVDDESLENLVTGMPKGLKNLEMNITGCEGVTDEGVTYFIDSLPKGVEMLNLTLDGTSVSNQSAHKGARRVSDVQNTVGVVKKVIRKHAYGSEYGQDFGWRCAVKRPPPRTRSQRTMSSMQSPPGSP